MLKPKKRRRAEGISDAALHVGLGLARFGRIDDLAAAAEPRRREIQPIYKGVNKPHRVVRADIVIHGLRQKQKLRTVVTSDVRHAGFYRVRRCAGIRSADFPHSLLDVRTAEATLSALCSRSLTTWRMGEDAPHRPLPELG